MPAKDIKEKIHDLDKQIAVLRTVEEMDVKAILDATSLQAKEYERRLELLNGESGRLKAMQAQYLPRETWEGNLAEIRKDINSLMFFKENAAGRQSVVSGVIAFVISLVFLIINFLIRKG